MFLTIIKQGFANLLRFGQYLLLRFKLQRRRAKIQSRLNRHFLQMGRSVYEHRGNLRDAAPDITPLAKETAALEVGLQAIDEDLQKLAGSYHWDIPGIRIFRYVGRGEAGKPCPHCDAYLPLNSLFCPNCGTALASPQPPSSL